MTVDGDANYLTKLCLQLSKQLVNNLFAITEISLKPLINQSQFRPISEVYHDIQFGDILAINRTNFIHYVIVIKLLPNYQDCVCLQIIRKSQLAFIDENLLSNILLDNQQLRKLRAKNRFLIPNASHKSLIKIDNQEAFAAKHNLVPRNLQQLTEVINAIKSLVNCKVDYDVLSNNCEHYVTGWKYGFKWCSQRELFIFANNQTPRAVGEEKGCFPLAWDQLTENRIKKMEKFYPKVLNGEIDDQLTEELRERRKMIEDMTMASDSC